MSPRIIVFIVTFNQISLIKWQPFLLVEETRVAGDMKTINYKMGLINNISNINVKNFDIPGANLTLHRR
jgi:hypothetical protein